eukprot:CAMPEP_0185281448 /NCGR_PEP_ID=MMETSP1359-20130426/66725_1 /TAXON_ID=552665 /ORGANISM="Bigelowiella longifila, Strain CCMP242" /LENGTH=35 /DNA_ID= /DNA_START= /DNA_END= /DNA_ORIENTATION=
MVTKDMAIIDLIGLGMEAGKFSSCESIIAKVKAAM